ncbi:MAG TPA: ATP-dependent protease ATPase subunit HslU [Blastocatellia bacterium]|nr:ATP-dependent protease ATPase subunit HslU [Blastocatellia bacterium]HMX27289.1 ATP-dependent protease ATPase subunit HslU [Blastocatellia bacterium]HMY74638.1 ATP-dependent protease ATPase subunit HslU [Blastocatellia bacterium]HMZ21692.1 ATP-dependent protease ATPase subunit HslU [Blastocatellia bacterium]HNG32961.1 ATP-dependent protease ATPase subunit HslU [Blastocatellia bacterium]
MVVYLKGDLEEAQGLDNLTPRQIVAELDKHVVGQAAAKRAVAVALRNRVRRQKLPADMAQDVMPKNIIMIGSTGVGKTEIARRLARLSSSPFLKVEASKFTEVGYVGRDVESMIRDLVEIAIDMVRAEKVDEIADKAEQNVEERILDLLLPPSKSSSASPFDPSIDQIEDTPTALQETYNRTREKFRQQLREGRLDNRIVEMEVRERNFPSFEIYTNQGIEEMDVNLKDMMPGLFGGRTKSRKMTVAEAMEYLMQEEEQKLVDMDQVARIALERVESSGIIFLDEIDKIAGREGGHGPDVSREGVQRDILPIVEGTTVNTKYGMVRTDHILFIAAGAFHVSKPSDMIPELQGRFPIRVELQPLTIDDFKRILTEPKNALVKQYKALMETEGIELDFTDDAIDELANFAFKVNETTEDIGARRLHTILEKVLDEISFEGPDLKEKQQKIDAAYIQNTLADIVKNEDLSRYIL